MRLIFINKGGYSIRGGGYSAPFLSKLNKSTLASVEVAMLSKDKSRCLRSHEKHISYWIDINNIMMYIGLIATLEFKMAKNIPAYMNVYTKLKAMIFDDTYQIGSLMPTEPELCKMFNVSRTTVRKAMELLEQGGFIKIQQGRGTEVLDYKTTQNLNLVSSFTETLELKGYSVQSKSTHIDMCIPPNNVLDDLNLLADSQVVRIQRIQLANGKPVALMTNYVLPDIVPGILSDAGAFVSLYHHLESKYGILITSARDSIKAKVSDFLESELLQIPTGSPLLVDRRITYSSGRPIEVVIMIVDASKYEFSVNLSGRTL